MLTVKSAIAPYDANSRLPVRSNPQLPVPYRGNNPGNVQLKTSPSRFSGLTDSIKGATGKLKIGPATGFVTGLAALNMLGQESAETLAENPEVQASWTKFKNSSYLDPEAMPFIHDSDLSEDSGQAILQMAPAAKALELRRNALENLDALAVSERDARSAATQNMLAGSNPFGLKLSEQEAISRAGLDNWNPNTKTVATTDRKPKGTGTGSSQGNWMDSLTGLLGLLALGGGAYYLGKKL